jgi:uncharacterized membrane protein
MENIIGPELGQFIVSAGIAVEIVGVLMIVIGALWASLKVVTRFLASERATIYDDYRRALGRSMMLGLEFLVAGDIIRTVIVAHTVEDVLGLGLIVIIRTVLVFTIHLEVEGRWPWQQKLAAISADARQT